MRKTQVFFLSVCWPWPVAPIIPAYSAQIGHPVQLKPATQSTGIRPPGAQRRRG